MLFAELSRFLQLRINVIVSGYKNSSIITEYEKNIQL